MHVLCSIRPFHGHLHPFEPVARALRAAGHDVTFATEAAFCSVVERCGFATLPAGVDPFAPAPWEGYEFSQTVTAKKVEDLLGIAVARPIDLILRDPTDFAAVIAAEVLRTPQVTIGFSRFCPTWWWRSVLGSSLDALRDSYCLPHDTDLKRLYTWGYVDTVPAWLQDSTCDCPTPVSCIRPVPYEAPAPPDGFGLNELPAKPFVVVTLGTVYNRRPDLLGLLCRGVRRAGCEVVCTVGPRQGVDVLPDAIPGVHVTDYVPLRRVLPHCAAVVSHGGYNTVISAVEHGVPLMLVPLGADNAVNAERCVEVGVGLMELPETLDERRVTEIVSAIVLECGFRNAARRLAAETAELPPPEAVVPLLEQLARERGVRRPSA